MDLEEGLQGEVAHAWDLHELTAGRWSMHCCQDSARRWSEIVAVTTDQNLRCMLVAVVFILLCLKVPDLWEGLLN